MSDGRSLYERITASDYDLAALLATVWRLEKGDAELPAGVPEPVIAAGIASLAITVGWSIFDGRPLLHVAIREETARRWLKEHETDVDGAVGILCAAGIDLDSLPTMLGDADDR